MSFGFAVTNQTRKWDYTEGELVSCDLWHVELPQQFDAWMIAGDPYGDGVSHDEAVRLLSDFVNEALVALRELTARRQLS